jgi:hypothetical protein
MKNSLVTWARAGSINSIEARRLVPGARSRPGCTGVRVLHLARGWLAEPIDSIKAREVRSRLIQSVTD